MVPFGYMHHNARAWGADNSKFNPTRFLRTKEGHAVNNPAYRPFGAGGNSCPGKALALRQVLSSVAYFLHTYDLSVPIIGGKKQSMPIALSSTPTIGTSVPQAGKDLIVQLSPRLSEPVSHIIATSSQIPS
jgi:cytochrome P450